MLFLRLGFDVFVSDAVERGRAWCAPYPEVYAEPLYFRTGREPGRKPSASGRSAPGMQTGPNDMLTRASNFRLYIWRPSGISSCRAWGTNNEHTQHAYDALVSSLGGGIVLTHSQGGNFGIDAALHTPDRVKAIISLESSGAPDSQRHNPARLRGVPHLFVSGDYLDKHPFWVRSVPEVRQWSEALAEASVEVEWIELPERGITGNSHALMADDNSDNIAAIVLDWMERNRLTT
jgi:pimeloyl-ACP methyl ester carboxylesterase